VFHLNLNSQSHSKPRESALVRSATLADLPSLLVLERQCPTAAHWSEQQYEKLFHPAAESPINLVLVADFIGEVCSPPDSTTSSTANHGIRAFLVARHIAPEWELENIVVAPQARRTGLGTQLLATLFERARKSSSQSVFLEVRESNAAARSLYEKAGFRLTAFRQSYYTNPREDAAVYTHGLD
jgi:ribosomal-protein-alanine N-acetyltransferase